MRTEIVEDDDVAFGKCGHQLRLNVDLEHIAVDGAIDHPGRVNAVMPQRRHECHGPPVAERHFCVEPFAACAPAPQRSHIGFCPGFINEHKASGVNARLPRLPAQAFAGNVRAILLGGQNAFF